jgi:hypothetical protein
MPATLGGRVLWWVAVLASSTLVLIAGEALARRVLPLVGLLRLSLMFPGRAPSRVDVARRSSRRELEELSDQVRTHGLGPDAEEAAVVLVRLIAALDAHDRRTRGHSERVRVYTDLLAHRLHLGPDDANKLRWAALLHDIGKLSVPAEVLNKPGRLTAEEWELIHEHPAEGDRMLGALREWLGPWASVVLEHHERWDGGGYPAGIAGHDISLGARLVAVADSYDVMTSIRSYQPQPRTPEGARDELVRCSGSQFDPGMVRCFLNISTRHLWWILGPLTWLVQIPVVGRAAAAAIRRPQISVPALGQPVLSGFVAITLMAGTGGLGSVSPQGAAAAPLHRRVAAASSPAREMHRSASSIVHPGPTAVASRPVHVGSHVDATPPAAAVDHQQRPAAPAMPTGGHLPHPSPTTSTTVAPPPPPPSPSVPVAAGSTGSGSGASSGSGSSAKPCGHGQGLAVGWEHGHGHACGRCDHRPEEHGHPHVPGHATRPTPTIEHGAGHDHDHDHGHGHDHGHEHGR